MESENYLFSDDDFQLNLIVRVISSIKRYLLCGCCSVIINVLAPVPETELFVMEMFTFILIHCGSKSSKVITTNKYHSTLAITKSTLAISPFQRSWTFQGFSHSLSCQPLQNFSIQLKQQFHFIKFAWCHKQDGKEQLQIIALASTKLLRLSLLFTLICGSNHVW